MKPAYAQPCDQQAATQTLRTIESLFFPMPPLPASVISESKLVEEVAYIAAANKEATEIINSQILSLAEVYEELLGSFNDLKRDLQQGELCEPIRKREEIKPMCRCSDILEMLYPQVTFFPYSLRLRTPMNPLHYRCKSFRYESHSLSFRLVSDPANQQGSVLPLSLTIQPYTVTKPSVPITTGRSGESLLVGRTMLAVSDVNKILFYHLRFSDVTKPFPMGHVTLVIHAVDRCDVQPFVLEGIRVKARNRTVQSDLSP